MIKAAILLFVIVGFWWSVRSLEQKSMYFPDKVLTALPQTYGLEAEDVWLKTPDGRKINGWFLPAKAVSDKTYVVLLSHGNAGNISHRLDKAARLHTLGLSVFLYDYAGYGKSEGTPSEQITYADADAAYRYLADERKISADKMIFYGESLGCAVATELALRHPGAGLVLESAFTSSIEMGKLVFPWLPVKWIVRYHYDNLAKISKLQMPLLMLHSPQDEVVPFEMGRRLFAAAPEPKQFVQLVGGHNDGYSDSGERYLLGIQGFIILLKEQVKKS